MLVIGFPAVAFGTNCYVLAPAAGEECVVVDPGVGVVDRLAEVVAEHQLRPVAVVLTHGHLDHTFSVAPVGGAYGVPAYIHPGDTDLLADPLKGLSEQAAAMMASFGPGLTYTAPEDVRAMGDGTVLELAGLTLVVDHAPGHTPGSVLLRTDARIPVSADPGQTGPLCLSGDVLFAGSIGRTDLPGGDPQAMRVTLVTRVASLDPATVVLPGHGPRTTIGAELASNPYLRALAAVSR
ncbi:MAG: MBL fold metallo-hydrolase [Actinomycetes bacterium]